MKLVPQLDFRHWLFGVNWAKESYGRFPYFFFALHLGPLVLLWEDERMSDHPY